MNLDIEKFINSKRGRIVVAALFLLAFLYASFIRAPIAFPESTLVTIEEGTSINAAGDLLEEQNFILSSALFTFLAEHFSEVGAHSGTYSFDRPLSIYGMWHRVSNGITGEPTIKVTIPEGSSTREMAVIFQRDLPNFDGLAFRELAREKEGYLFPDTYVVAPGISEEAIIELMEATFFEKMNEIEEELILSGRSLEEVVIMASILEKEARLFETRQIVAGILWKRIEIEMPLQVDAVFGYIYDRATFSPTFDELEIDSPYNTYENLGLPPGPITNPGLSAIKAALDPIETPYLFYLTGSDGTMHYARTFEAHKENRRFLR